MSENTPVQDTNTPTPASETKETPATRFPSLLAALIAVVAWVVLIYGNGVVAMAVAAVAVIAGFYAARKGWKSLATAAIIAGLVLIVVTGAFLLVIKYVL